jgi:hypothetical protein
MLSDGPNTGSMTKPSIVRLFRASLIAICLLLVGVVICPRPPAASEVDPNALLAAMRAASNRPGLLTVDLPDTRTITPLVEGKDVIAGRPAWVLRLKPHIKRTPWVQIWVDRRSHVILAFRKWDGNDRLLSSAHARSVSSD